MQPYWCSKSLVTMVEHAIVSHSAQAEDDMIRTIFSIIYCYGRSEESIVRICLCHWQYGCYVLFEGEAVKVINKFGPDYHIMGYDKICFCRCRCVIIYSNIGWTWNLTKRYKMVVVPWAICYESLVSSPPPSTDKLYIMYRLKKIVPQDLSQAWIQVRFCVFLQLIIQWFNMSTCSLGNLSQELPWWGQWGWYWRHSCNVIVSSAATVYQQVKPCIARRYF